MASELDEATLELAERVIEITMPGGKGILEPNHTLKVTDGIPGRVRPVAPPS